ncbi:MAG: ATP-dependent sacrificial sulfur transferase LarE [Nitrospirae bacterium]|nr:ATP-dependent sacrificial sulfur transferase LarE [Nitrospirota bacterium]MCL5423268.1 ATP-dependent sacrificial sulfur transferase LarE [Nitrospirota bacterium]
MVKNFEEISAKKLLRLREVLSSLEAICIAYSGGVDSTFLLRVSKDVLGENVLAVTATSPTYPHRELNEAIESAQKIGVRHLLISSNELDIPGFSENTTNRCYYCKHDLFQKLKAEAEKCGIKAIADGSNYDDTKDYRPGRKAAKELGVRSPLCEAGLTKNEIRYLSKELGLNTWNKPSLACLSSRIPYHEKITEEKLKQVEKAEGILRDMGFTQFRVRHHNDIARLEFIPDEMSLLKNAEIRLSIDSALKSLGFKYVTVDLKGYRTGSMNEVLEIYERRES